MHFLRPADENLAQENHHRHRNFQSSIGLADLLTQNDHGASAVMYLRPSPTYKLSHPTVLYIAVTQTHTHTYILHILTQTQTHTDTPGHDTTYNLLHTTMPHTALLCRTPSDDHGNLLAGGTRAAPTPPGNPSLGELIRPPTPSEIPSPTSKNFFSQLSRLK